jgi:hypothetical protein
MLNAQRKSKRRADGRAGAILKSEPPHRGVDDLDLAR